MARVSVDIDKDALESCMKDAIIGYFNDRCEYYGLDAETIEKQAKTIRALRSDEKTPWNEVVIHGYPKYKENVQYLVIDEHNGLHICSYFENLQNTFPLDFTKPEKGFVVMNLVDGVNEPEKVTPTFWKEIKFPAKIN